MIIYIYIFICICLKITDTTPKSVRICHPLPHCNYPKSEYTIPFLEKILHLWLIGKPNINGIPHLMTLLVDECSLPSGYVKIAMENGHL